MMRLHSILGLITRILPCTVLAVTLGGCGSSPDKDRIPATDGPNEFASIPKPLEAAEQRAQWAKTLQGETTSTAPSIPQSDAAMTTSIGVFVSGADFYGDNFNPPVLYNKTIQLLQHCGGVETTVTLQSPVHGITGDLQTFTERSSGTGDPIVSVHMHSITVPKRDFEFVRDQPLGIGYRLEKKVEIPSAVYVLQIDYYKFTSAPGAARPVLAIKGFKFE